MARALLFPEPALLTQKQISVKVQIAFSKFKSNFTNNQVKYHTLNPHIVLSFHGIGVPPAGVPADERPYWMDEELFASFIAEASSRARALGIGLHTTFDDGNRSDLEIAAPILAKHGLSGSFFPCTGRLKTSGYLSEEDVRRLFNLGFEIGSHGIDHVRWTHLDENALDREIALSKSELEQFLATKIQTVAIPFGSYNRRILAALKVAGYTKVYTCDPGFAYPGQWLMRRWYYNSNELFDLAYFVSRSSSFRHRMLVDIKGIIKALR